MDYNDRQQTDRHTVSAKLRVETLWDLVPTKCTLFKTKFRPAQKFNDRRYGRLLLTSLRRSFYLSAVAATLFTVTTRRPSVDRAH